MEEALENGKESSHSAHANGIEQNGSTGLEQTIQKTVTGQLVSTFKFDPGA
jgi:hypothetical protein